MTEVFRVTELPAQIEMLAPLVMVTTGCAQASWLEPARKKDARKIVIRLAWVLILFSSRKPLPDQPESSKYV